jgi:hypothetical protein
MTTGAAAAFGALIALATLVMALLEYARQGRQKRAEHFFDLRLRLKENVDFATIAVLLDEADSSDSSEAEEKLASYSFRAKRDYVGLFEEVALAMNSGLLRPQVAHYMFGYYAILCWECGAFWANVNKFTKYWSLMDDFYEKMKAQQDDFEFRAKDFRF